MKLIETNSRSATLQFSRRELADLSTTICVALGVMLELRADGTSFSPDERFLPRVQALQQRISRLVLKQGWLDDYEDLEDRAIELARSKR
jgi:hypothetical protein